VDGGRVYLTASEGKQLLTLAVDAVTGEILWKKGVEFDGSRIGANSSAAPTPATDGVRVYAFFHHVGLVAYDLEGKELWRNSVGSPYDIPHGMASSPVVSGGKVVLQIDQDSSSRLLALDAATGMQVWETARPGVTHGYSTPVIHTPEGGEPQVVVSGALQVAGYSLETGEKLWWANGSAWQVKAVPIFTQDLCIVNAFMVPSSELGGPPIEPVWEKALADMDEDGDSMISREEWPDETMQMVWFIFDLDGDEKLDAKDYAYLVSAGNETGGLIALRLGGKGDITDSHIAWRYEKSRGLSDVLSPVVIGETLFMIKEGGILTAMNAGTGEVSKQERVGSPDRYFASPVAADGRLLVASLSGQLSVVDGKPDWEVLSTTDLEEEIWSSPALAGELVYVRTQKALYCFFNEES
jgi:outer membrane protein assembly factor BamB